MFHKYFKCKWFQLYSDFCKILCFSFGGRYDTLECENFERKVILSNHPCGEPPSSTELPAGNVVLR